MKDFLDYDQKYPNLVFDIMQYFSLEGNRKPQEKSIGDFCQHYPRPQEEDMLQPEVIGKVCDRLVAKRMLSILRHGGALRYNDCYMCIQQKGDHPLVQKYQIERYNSMVYGFEYIYRLFKDRVKPIVAYHGDDQPMGSCFRLFEGLVTAKHCLTDGERVAIKGYTADQLSRCQVLISENPDIDIAFIATGELPLLNTGTPKVLDDILVMGYPKVPFFLNFCTAEKATISAQAEVRMTHTLGAIAAQEKMYSPAGLPEIMLITAKIRGGNSGGPVINDEGLVVGVATGVPRGEGFSDDNVGYGMAYPISIVDDIKQNGKTMKVNFVDFPED